MKTEGHKRYLKEKEDWKCRRKSPESGYWYTWEDMHSMESAKELEMTLVAAFTVLVFSIAMSLLK